MKKLMRVLAVVLMLTVLAGMVSVAAAEKSGTIKFAIEQQTLKGAQTVNKEFKLTHKAKTLNVTVKITSNITGEEKDVDIYRLKYEVLDPSGKRIGSQVALDALEGKYISTQSFTNVPAGKLKVRIITNSAAANLIYTITVTGEYPITLSKSKAVLKPGGTLKLVSDYTKGFTKTWTSSNTAVATVTDNGLVVGRGAGTAKVTLSAGNQTEKCDITVYGVKPERATLYTKESMKLGVTGATSADKITWSSGDTSKATVNAKGKVTAKKAGKVKIYATVQSAIDGKSYTCSCVLTVKQNPFPKTMKVVGGKLALRKSPSVDGELIDYYKAGTKVTVKSIANGWAKVTIGKTGGYMMLKYLEDVK